MIGGFSQLPLSPTKSGSTSSAHLVVAVSFTLPSELHGNIAPGMANTIQLPAMSLNGLGSFTPKLYGHTQIAIPNPKVIVGAIYILNCDAGPIGIPVFGSSVTVGKSPPAHIGEGNQKTA